MSAMNAMNAMNAMSTMGAARDPPNDAMPGKAHGQDQPRAWTGKSASPRTETICCIDPPQLGALLRDSAGSRKRGPARAAIATVGGWGLHCRTPPPVAAIQFNEVYLPPVDTEASVDAVPASDKRYWLGRTGDEWRKFHADHRVHRQAEVVPEDAAAWAKAMRALLKSKEHTSSTVRNSGRRSSNHRTHTRQDSPKPAHEVHADGRRHERHRRLRRLPRHFAPERHRGSHVRRRALALGQRHGNFCLSRRRHLGLRGRGLASGPSNDSPGQPSPARRVAREGWLQKREGLVRNFRLVRGKPADYWLYSAIPGDVSCAAYPS
ncbi:MAG: hypothetical protein MZW92_81185 [Comamonadaceae bacterium]|nr:hypothetical protein [Comamonadaceae bacterium]